MVICCHKRFARAVCSLITCPYFALPVRFLAGFIVRFAVRFKPSEDRGVRIVLALLKIKLHTVIDSLYKLIDIAYERGIS